MIARDKQLHFAAGAVLAVSIFWTGPVLSLLLVALAGAAKEAWDATGRGQVEFADFVWTVAGWVPVAGVYHVLS
jgi:hypothetical protein